VKLGLLTAPFVETPLLEAAEWAASTGFETLEIAHGAANIASIPMTQRRRT
jgi:sugar phosphate isomerase/epimerase